MSLKLLVCGDIKGKLDELYKKIAVIEKKNGKFDSVFCIGDVFGDNTNFITDYIEQRKKTSVETFLISPLPDSLKTVIDEKGSEVCRNITYLGDKGIIKCHDLKIAFLSSDTVKENDIKDISNKLMCTNISYSGIDILFTTIWPSGIENGASDLPDYKMSTDWGSDLISALASLVQPRYHFTAGKEIFYERLPYKNQKNTLSKQKHATRFIALSSFKNAKNDKHLYAFLAKPMELMTQEELLNIPKDATENPFSSINTDSILSHTKQQFFYDMPSDRKRKAGDDHDGNQKKQKNNTSDGCWFCLGNPQVEKHLVVHVGNETYIAMPRGPLDNEHMLILTVGHYQSFITCPKEVAKEIKTTMKSVKKYFTSKGQSVVFFERNFKTNHFQMQAVPIDMDKLEECQKLFLEMAADQSGPGENFREIPSRTKLEEIAKPNTPYFYVEFNDGTRLFGLIPRNQLQYFDLQFGRTVLSEPAILNCPEKIEWKNCTKDRDTEEALTKKLKKSISEFL